VSDSTGHDETFREAEFLDIVQGDRMLAIELAQLFLDDLEPRMEEIRAAIRSGDPRRLRSAAHTLKGSAGSVSGARVAASALALEVLGRSGKIDGAEGLFTELTAAGADLRLCLTKFAGRS
jgi:HPt (histidine-containing phosphotransfer) domain-containing protein